MKEEYKNRTFREFDNDKTKIEELLNKELNTFIKKYNLKEVNVGKVEYSMHYIMSNKNPFDETYALEVIL